jgi:hypothetical protein
MADETKKYIVYVESNLKKYADDAAKAKEEVDALTDSTTKMKKAGLENTAEYQKETAQLQLKKQELRDLQKVVQAGIQLTNKELSYRQQLTAAIKISIQAIKDMGNGYVKNAQGIDVINPKLIQERKNLAELNLELIKHDKSLNSGATNVGRYGEALSGIGTSIKDAAISMVSFAAVAALAAKAIQGIKDAFFSTDQGMSVLKQWAEAAKTFFYGVINTHGKDDIKLAVAAAKEIERLRVQDRKDAREIVRMETEINILRFQSVDATKTATEQLVYLNKLQEKENELIRYKKDDLIEEIRAMEMLWQTRREDSNLLDAINAKRVELERIEGERSFRIESRKSGLLVKADKEKEVLAAKEEARLKKKFDDDQKAILDGQKALQKEVDDYNKAAEEKFNTELEFQRKLYEFNRKAGQEEYDARIAQEQAMADAEMEIRQQLADSRINLALSVENILNVMFRENKKLQNVALIASGAMAIADVIIQTTRANATIRTMAAASVLPGPGYLARLAVAMAAAMVPINLNRIAAGVDIAAIVAATAMQAKSNSQSNSAGGGGSAPTAITTSPPAQRATGTPVGSSLLSPQLSQGQVNAIPNFNPMTAADIAEIIKNMPAPIVTVQDINKVQANKKKVEVRANI